MARGFLPAALSLTPLDLISKNAPDISQNQRQFYGLIE
ncbi:hypothetical protein KKC1_11410 [Calderihabitans maritimus]|uniref:Uncharacterized protein n=1 Tax=Calderihabitans maritimus TaxID=1246530 RepID=A0A1Z5HRM3_9FIRM|nr:hypothetical protein KKC1_11410 [Calderihabitans maritimus]